MCRGPQELPWSFFEQSMDTTFETGIIVSGEGVGQTSEFVTTIVVGDCLIHIILLRGSIWPLLCSGPVATSSRCSTGFFIGTVTTNLLLSFAAECRQRFHG